MSRKPSYKELEQRISELERDASERHPLDKAPEKSIFALTQPLDEEEGIHFKELFNLEEIQEIQDAFAKGACVASIITHPDGTSITKPSNFCRLCEMIIQKTDKGLKNCHHSYALVGRHNPDGPIIQHCLSGGLWDAGASITVGGKHIANWLIGQVRNETQDEVKMLEYALEIGADVAAFRDALREVPTMSQEQFGNVTNALFLVANQLSTTAYQNVQQARFITEHKRAEEELRERERRLSMALEGADEGLWDYYPPTDEAYFSPRWYTMLDYEADEFPHIFKSWTELLHPEDRPRTEKRVLDFLENHEEQYSVEFRMRTKGGGWRWILSRGKAVEWDADGNITRMVGTHIDTTDRKKAEDELKRHRDHLEEIVAVRTKDLQKANEELLAEITERKRAHDALQASEEKYRDLVENANSIILRWDKEGKIIFMNPFGLDFFGYDKEELIGRNVVGSIVPETETSTSRDLKLLMKDVQKDPDSYKNNENENMRKDGGRVWVSWTNKAITGGNGSVKEILSIGNDITEKKHLETRLQQALKMEAIGTLAGGVAHDLNNVLSGIVTYPELLLMQISEDSPLMKPLLTIQDTGKKAAGIVQDLLTLARRGVIVSKVVNLNNIIREYFKSPEYEKLLSFHPNFKVETNLETDLLNVLGSPVHLSKTIMNLVSNAAEAMTHGGNLSISTITEYIDSVIRGYDDVEAGNYVVLSVSDTGEGMSAEDMQRIFEPFFTKKKMGRSGTGLGMAVVWGTVNDHKGYIDLQSTLGEGTLFKLYFPATKQQPVEDQPEITPDFYRGSGETILVVDDVKEQREIASSLLTELNYSVAVASSGENAIEYLKNKTVDLLLLDMIMTPGMDGLDTYKQILRLHPAQKALIASGFSETDRVREAQELGAGQYLKKPYTLEKLGIAVKNGLNQK